MITPSRRSRKHRRMVALLLVLLAVLVAVQGRDLWLKITHPFKYEQIVRTYAEEYRLDPLLVAAVINVESKFDPEAESRKGAKGLMQLMDETAVWGSEETGMTDFSSEQLFIPENNIKLGCWYLARLLKQYDGNNALALAAYNGGSGNVAKWLQDPALSPDGKSLETIPFPETEAYVEKVLKQYESYQELYGTESP